MAEWWLQADETMVAHPLQMVKQGVVWRPLTEVMLPALTAGLQQRHHPLQTQKQMVWEMKNYP